MSWNEGLGPIDCILNIAMTDQFGGDVWLKMTTFFL